MYPSRLVHLTPIEGGLNLIDETSNAALCFISRCLTRLKMNENLTCEWFNLPNTYCHIANPAVMRTNPRRMLHLGLDCHKLCTWHLLPRTSERHRQCSPWHRTYEHLLALKHLLSKMRIILVLTLAEWPQVCRNLNMTSYNNTVRSTCCCSIHKFIPTQNSEALTRRLTACSEAIDIWRCTRGRLAVTRLTCSSRLIFSNMSIWPRPYTLRSHGCSDVKYILSSTTERR